MARKTKKKRTPSKPRKPGWWRSLDPDRRRHVLVMVVLTVAFVALLVTGRMAVAKLDAHVNQKLVRSSAPTLVFPDMPDRLAVLAEGDLRAQVANLLHGDWMRPDLCRWIAESIAKVGWVEKVRAVRRTPAGRFEVRCTYRTPAAMVRAGEHYVLVDRYSIRLPGIYIYDPSWILIQGVAAMAPQPGDAWLGKDLQAGLAVIDALSGAPYATQITAVDVENFAGRKNRRRSHIELATDRAGGRIRWGSAPGLELEENSVAQKTAILSQNYRETGRADAGHTVIDVSVYPDRYTIPAS